MSRISPGNTLRHKTEADSPGPADTLTRQQTHVSPAGSCATRSRRDPRSVTRATQVAVRLAPSRLSIHATSTVPSGVTARSSNECEIGRSSLTRRGASKERPPSSERDRNRSDANSPPTGLGLLDDQVT